MECVTFTKISDVMEDTGRSTKKCILPNNNIIIFWDDETHSYKPKYSQLCTETNVSQIIHTNRLQHF